MLGTGLGARDMPVNNRNLCSHGVYVFPTGGGDRQTNILLGCGKYNEEK